MESSSTPETKPEAIASMVPGDGEPLTRETLYRAVWRTPMRTLARRFGCSDRGLSKACERYRIPVPPRGYWAKLAVGQRVPRPPLPKLSVSEEGAIGQIELPSPSPRAPEPGTVAAEVAVQVASSKQRILVRDTLHGSHALVLKTRDLFESARADERGILHPDGRGYQRKNGALAIHVSKAQVHRGLRIFDALVKAIEANGWTVTCPAKSQNHGTGVKLFGEEIAISLEEKVKRFDAPKKPERVTKGYTHDIGRGPYVTIMVDPYPRYTYEPLGQLALRVPGYGSPSLQIADGTTQKLEERIAEFLIGVVRLAERQQDRRRRWEEEERQYQEALRRQQEAERRRAEERERVEALMRDATTWRRAEELRAYVAALRQKEPAISAERESYCIWALAQADSIDPLRRR